MSKRKHLKTELREILSESVVHRGRAKSKRVSLLGAILVTQANRALQGSDSAAKAVLEVARACELFDGNHQEHALDLSKLTVDELKALERITAKSQIIIRDDED